MLVANKVTKLYSNNMGVVDFSAEIEDGEILTLIGPNGSGKSTTLKIMAGIMKSEKGNVLIDNMDTISTSTKRYIGYLPEEMFLYEKMSVYELLTFIASTKFNKNLKDSIKEALIDYDLWEHRHQIIKNLSMGMKKKVGIISAFLGEPKLIILDEPTNGLDTKGIITLKKQIGHCKNKGSIIIISSHILDFVYNISSRFIFLKESRVVRDMYYNNSLELEKIYSELYI
ncbi:ATP-binding cassette domain-containing protein [Clostridium manihotivorum]|uniref:ABC transporter n=1 Tax=Clostridium manihotivorum TaxID=2320868 RepID=A0A3R5U352_9CLOT|nr:ABC transporter ATP-binding protein [Clostridium manihotivorum]QAA30381.1 ABC transporter [Clostridium manihotivorum]